jgi:hypothetical protein
LCRTGERRKDMIRFTGEVVRSAMDGITLFVDYVILNGRLYEFDNKEEGKSFYEFWQKH